MLILVNKFIMRKGIEKEKGKGPVFVVLFSVQVIFFLFHTIEQMLLLSDFIFLPKFHLFHTYLLL